MTRIGLEGSNVAAVSRTMAAGSKHDERRRRDGAKSAREHDVRRGELDADGVLDRVHEIEMTDRGFETFFEDPTHGTAVRPPS
jgi:hypothetical protein